jgi:hypothetical protein
MKKLHILATVATLLMTASAPALAAQRMYPGSDAYASGAVTMDRSGSYYYGPRDAQGRAIGGVPSLGTQASPWQFNRGQNLPYPDRPYGNPDTW